MKDLDYWELRKEVSKIIPRQTVFLPFIDKEGAVKEKGRKSNYNQFDLIDSKWKKHERLLNTEEVKSFLEISIRAAACPMPLNLDVWDSLCCIAKGEKVKSQRGEIPIEEAKVGDIVLSFNESKNELEWKPISEVNSIIKENMIEIETEKGKLLVTEDHPIYTQRGYIRADELTEKDILYENSQTGLYPIKIKDFQRFKRKMDVYDITVEDNSNFFASNILVHNCPFGCKYCFPSGTKILMEDGTEKVIERIKEKDSIMSFNPETKDIEPAIVKETMNREEKEITKIELEDGKVLRMTSEHPIWTKKGWVEAGNLTEDDEVLIW